jgi:hypothetical protein
MGVLYCWQRVYYTLFIYQPEQGMAHFVLLFTHPLDKYFVLICTRVIQYYLYYQMVLIIKYNRSITPTTPQYNHTKHQTLFDVVVQCCTEPDVANQRHAVFNELGVKHYPLFMICT